MHLRTRTHSPSSPNLCRGFFLVLGVLVFCIPNILASTNNSLNPVIQGVTIDTQGQIVPYVSLEFIKSDISILSDIDGYFAYNAPLIIEDSILVRRIGFESHLLSVKQLFSNSTIILKSTVLSMEAVEIQGLAGSSSTALPRMGNYTKTEGSGSMDHSKLLGRIPGFSIKAYGGPAGISTLSIDGGPSSHTKVLVDGIDITSAQNGEADLSQIPLPLVESMSYIPFDIGQSSSGATDGIIKLVSGGEQNHLAISHGSYGHVAYDLNLGERIFGLWTALQFGHRSEAGNFPVLWDDQEITRQNNDLEQDFAAFRIQGMLRSNIVLHFSAMESRQSRGVAGLVWSPDLSSHRDDKLQLMGSTIAWLRTKGHSNLQISLRRSKENYKNPTINIESDHDLESYAIEFNNQQIHGKPLSTVTNFRMSRDRITSSEMQEHTRQSYISSVTPILHMYHGIKFIPGIKLHYSPHLYKRILTDVQIQIPLRLGPLSELSASRGEVYRYPSFNDQYWEPGGNPDLEPEQTIVTTAQVKVNFIELGELILQWQQKESSNLIQWMPVHSYWQPGNILSAARRSAKAMWTFEFIKPHLTGFACYSLISTIDQNLNKPLRYAPNQTSAIGLTWNPAPFELNAQYNYVSDRVSSYDYPEDTVLKATNLWSMSAAYTWKLRTNPITLILTADNLLDSNYETIRGYPEPGRTLRLNARYSWQ